MNKVHADLRSIATEDAPVRLSWPNGAYAYLPDAPAPVVEEMFRLYGPPDASTD